MAQVGPCSKKVARARASTKAVALALGPCLQAPRVCSRCTGSRKPAAGFGWRHVADERTANATEEAEIRLTSARAARGATGRAEVRGTFSTEEDEAMVRAKVQRLLDGSAQQT